jgi:hypothetical protein
MGEYQFLAVCWGHASPFNLRLMNVAEGGAEIRPMAAGEKRVSNQPFVKYAIAQGLFYSARPLSLLPAFCTIQACHQPHVGASLLAMWA